MASDVLIVGGGVIGLSIARSLALASLRVALFDRQLPGQEASWAGAGILPPTAIGSPDDPLIDMTRRTHALWPRLSAELRETTGIDNGFRRCGGLRLLVDPSATAELTFREQPAPEAPETVDAWRTAGATAELISGAEARRLEPALSATIDSAIWLPDVWQVRNPWHLRALLADCQRLNVEIRGDDCVHEIDCRNGRVDGVRSDAGFTSAAQVVIASGAWSNELLPPRLRPVEIDPVRGQIVLLRQANASLRHVIECGHRYLVPREDGRLLIGSTEERAGFDKQTTPEAIAGLLQFAYGLVPTLSAAARERAWAGLRPYACGGRPYIGAVPECEGLFLAAGHFRAGLHLSPLTADIVRDAVRGRS